MPSRSINATNTGAMLPAQLNCNVATDQHVIDVALSTIETVNRNVRKLGALLYLFEKQFKFDALDRFEYHFYAFHHELQEQVIRDRLPNFIEVNSTAQDLCKLTTNWKKALRQELSISSNNYNNFVSEYFSEAKQLYKKLSQLTTFKDSPAYYDLGLLILESDPDITGIPYEFLTDVEIIESNLQIDPTIHKQQNGFGRVQSAAELCSVVALRQSRLFMVLKDENPLGFAIISYSNNSVRNRHAELITELTNNGIINDQEQIGWCETLGKLGTFDRQFHRVGCNLYQQIDQLIYHVAQHEGVESLIASVRIGDNKNVSIKSHLRMGWQQVDYTYTTASGVPYQVLKRPIAKSDSCSNKPYIGEGSHFETYHNSPALTKAAVECVMPMSLEQARQILSDYFKNNFHVKNINVLDGAHGGYIQINLGGVLVNLHQVRPNTDYWRVFGPDIYGSLAEILPQIIELCT